MFEPQKILDFLSQLSHNNNKVWFDQHRDQYQAARLQWIDFTQQMIGELMDLNAEFVHLDPRKCIYRINRDVRFGKDKTPYKKNFGAFFVPGGKMSGRAGYYLHLEPGNCFIAGGMHCPENTRVHQIRESIATDNGKFVAIVENKQFIKNIDDGIRGPRLKRPPRGFDPEHPALDYLKLKGYIVLKNIPDSDFLDPKFIQKTMKWFKMVQPFVDYLNQAID